MRDLEQVTDRDFKSFEFGVLHQAQEDFLSQIFRNIRNRRLAQEGVHALVVLIKEIEYERRALLRYHHVGVLILKGPKPMARVVSCRNRPSCSRQSEDTYEAKSFHQERAPKNNADS